MGLSVVCPECAASLAAVIVSVAESRADGVPAAPAEPPTEYDRLRAECATLIDRLHAGLDVMADMFTDDGDADLHLRALREFRVALLRLAYDSLGDPEAEETLAREGHDVA